MADSNKRAGLARATTLLALAGWFALCAGCVSGSLATSTGSRSAGRQWSVAPRQRAHVGETVHCDFVLTSWNGGRVDPKGVADYVVVRFGAERLEVEPDRLGHFRFEMVVPETALGRRLEVETTAHLQRGRRDHMFVGGEWRSIGGTGDPVDVVVARRVAELDVYQSEVVLWLDRPLDPFEPESGVLRLTRSDGESVSVYVDRPNRRGFRMSGPDDQGRFEVRFEPLGNDVTPFGTTLAEFSILDAGGQRHEARLELQTP